MIKNEDPKGSNPFPGTFHELSMDAIMRKRDYKKERNISPVAFNAIHPTSSRHDDKVSINSLNQFNRS